MDSAHLTNVYPATSTERMCRYRGARCHNEPAIGLRGLPLQLCEHHRQLANSNQSRRNRQNFCTRPRHSRASINYLPLQQYDLIWTFGDWQPLGTIEVLSDELSLQEVIPTHGFQELEDSYPVDEFQQLNLYTTVLDFDALEEMIDTQLERTGSSSDLLDELLFHDDENEDEVTATPGKD